MVGGLFPNVSMALIQAAKNDAAEARTSERAPGAAVEPVQGILQPAGDVCQRGHSRASAAPPPRPILPLNDAAQKRVADVLKALDLN